MTELRKVEEKMQAQNKREWESSSADLKQKRTRSIANEQNEFRDARANLTTALSIFHSLHERSTLDFINNLLEKDKIVQAQWKLLIRSIPAERGVLMQPHFAAWSLDPTEGPDRMRVKLRRAKRPESVPVLSSPVAKLRQPDAQFMTPDASAANHLKRVFNEDKIGQIYRHQLLLPGEKITFAIPSNLIRPYHKRQGELLIGMMGVYFLCNEEQPSEPRQAQRLTQKQMMIGDDLDDAKHMWWLHDEVREIHKRRYLLTNTAIEVFLMSGITFFVAFASLHERDAAYAAMHSGNLPNLVDYESEVKPGFLKWSITKRWRNGRISNFEYLSHLNTLAGRSFNDLTQYPIFPWVLRDYESNELNLDDPASFRDLSKPMGAQDPQRLTKFTEKYSQLEELGEVPYHYGSHYSNIGSVLHFLVRVQPYTSYFLNFQGGRFDVADRSFHHVGHTWRVSSASSSADVKECIPEFFYLPEFLENRDNLDLGVKQDNARVSDVVLPPWAHGSPRVFIKKHREALESRHVSENLHRWIDLIFGYQQQGEEARKAHNLFHPVTYEGAVDLELIEDEIEKQALLTQISSYGQTPKQLFNRPHPAKKFDKITARIGSTVLQNVQAIEATQTWMATERERRLGHISVLADTIVGLAQNKTLLTDDR
jgi:hypothetical protein